MFASEGIKTPWFIHEYKGILAADLLDVLAQVEFGWPMGKIAKRAQLTPLINASVLEEATP